MSTSRARGDVVILPRRLPAAIDRGLALCGQGRFFEAHEAMEESWIAEQGEIRSLWQGLIQAVVACHHIDRGNTGGARKMIDAALTKIEPFELAAAPVPSTGKPIDLPRLVRELRAAQRSLREGSPVTNLPCPVRRRSARG